MTPDRAIRIEAIRDAAIVRAALGQRALYRRLDDGRHQVRIDGRLGIGDTLDQAIDAARREGAR
jgi:hypothetical protein